MEFMPRVYDNAPILWAVFRQFMNEKLKIDKIAKSPAWNFFVLAIVLVNTVIVIYYFVENPSTEVLLKFIKRLQTQSKILIIFLMLFTFLMS